MIAVQGLTRRFGSLVAVEGLDLEVKEAEVFGFLGPNGAGKTTTVRLLAALIAPNAGTGLVAGFRLGREDRSIREHVGVLTEMPGLYKRLSTRDNLLFFARLHGVSDPLERADRYLHLFDLWEQRDQMAGSLSKGMQQKVAIARALIHDPRVLFLDEPTAGLDPEAAKVVRDLIETLRSERRTIFLCTHNLDEADRLCDRVALFRTHLVAVGKPRELKEGMYGRRTVVHMANARPGLEKALGLPFVTKTEWVAGKLVVSLTDPEQQNPQLVSRLVELGAQVQFVTELRHSLEDLYLDLLEKTDAAN